MKRAGIVLSASNWVNNRKQFLRRRKKEARWVDFIAPAGTIAAVFAAGAAIWLSIETHIGRIHDERPFIAVDVTAIRPAVSLTPELGDSVYNEVSDAVQFKMIVLGKSPAVNVRLICASEVMYREIVISPNEPHGDGLHSYLMPGQSVDITCRFPELKGAKPMTPDSIYAEYGVILYEGQGGEKYQTPYCEEVFLSEQGLLHMFPCPPGETDLPELK
jgi:hypothetical protein